MRILYESIAMKYIEDTWLDKFKDEVRNFWLSITMNGVNPYSLQNNNYCVWRLLVINNNNPPWLSMKNEHIMLDLIFLSRKQVKNMDVYLQPLIDGFKKLWEGI